MNGLPKVLVVDSGERSGLDSLSAELAELGLASVTTSFEAADDVLAVIDRPSAIFLNMSVPRHGVAHNKLLAFADKVRRADNTADIPVIEWDRAAATGSGGVSAILRARVGSYALSKPEL